MNKMLVFAAAALMLAGIQPALAGSSCASIKGGTITDVNGNPISVGFDKWGYNYQAHMFNGLYDNFARPATPATEGDVNLMMKWSDDWLSNQDCTGDGKLDRGDTGISKGWLTNHEEGDYLGADTQYHHYTYFVKIVYDAGAACNSGEPSCIWGSYTVIEEVFNDPYGGSHGVNRSTLVNPAGLGYYTN